MHRLSIVPGHDRRGLTLIEVLVIVVVIGILACMFFPATRGTREAARRTDCANRLRKITISLHKFHDARKFFPAVANDPDWSAIASPKAAERLNALPFLLPFLDEEPLFDEIAQESNFGGVSYPEAPLPDTKGYEPWQQQPEGFLCVSAWPEKSNGFGRIDYGFCIGSVVERIHNPSELRGVFGVGFRSNMDRDVNDGTSRTIAIGEIAGQWERSINGNYVVGMPPTILTEPALLMEYRDAESDKEYAPQVELGVPRRGAYWADGRAANIMFNTVAPMTTPSGAVGKTVFADGVFSPSSVHPAGVNIGLVDGSVRNIARDVDLTTWKQLGDANDGGVPVNF